MKMSVSDEHFTLQMEWFYKKDTSTFLSCLKTLHIHSHFYTSSCKQGYNMTQRQAGLQI